MVKKFICAGMMLIWGAVLVILQPMQLAKADDNLILTPLDLNGTEWSIEIEKDNASNEKDVLVFRGNKFTSKAYQRNGYGPTSYSLSVDVSGVTHFGTMQIKGKETVFWKGDIEGERIGGTIHVQYSSGDNMRYIYKGKLTKGSLKRKSSIGTVQSKGEQNESS